MKSETPDGFFSKNQHLPPHIEQAANDLQSLGSQNLVTTYLKYFPGVKNPAIVPGMLSGLLPDLLPEIPGWVKNASKKVWEFIGIPQEFHTDNMAEMGKIVGFVEALPGSKKEELRSPEIENLAAFFCDQLKIEAALSSPSQSKEFSDARVNAIKIPEKITFAPQRVKIHFAIVAYWPVIQELQAEGSTTEFHKWLLTLTDKSGNQIVAGTTDSREIRRICEDIGLSFNNAWRKPK